MPAIDSILAFWALLLSSFIYSIGQITLTLAVDIGPKMSEIYDVDEKFQLFQHLGG